MSTGYYLLDKRNPHTGGGVSPRRAPVSGTIFGHTTENVDLQGLDLGAENVVDWQSRTDVYSSYHLVVDSDSMIPCLPFGSWESYGARHGANHYAIHLAIAYLGHLWGQHPDRENRALANFALACLLASKWCREQAGVEVPRRLLTRSEVEQRKPGFVSHGIWQTDRSDPANNRDDWFWHEKVFPIMEWFLSLPKAIAPVGALDKVQAVIYSQILVAGWSADPSNLDAKVRVRVYVDGESVKSTVADDRRPDVARVFPEYGADRGYGLLIPSRPGRRHVKVYALDTDGSDHALLGERMVDVG